MTQRRTRGVERRGCGLENPASTNIHEALFGLLLSQEHALDSDSDSDWTGSRKAAQRKARVDGAEETRGIWSRTKPRRGMMAWDKRTIGFWAQRQKAKRAPG